MSTQRPISQWQSTGMMGGGLGYLAAAVLATVASLAAYIAAQKVCGDGVEGLCIPPGVNFAANLALIVAGPSGMLTAALGYILRRRRRAKGLAPDHEHPEAPIA